MLFQFDHGGRWYVCGQSFYVIFNVEIIFTMHIIRFIMSYGRLFVINVMENAMRLICISNKKCKYRGVDELKFMNDEYLSKNIFIIYI